MRTSAIVIFAAALASAQDLNGLPTDFNFPTDFPTNLPTDAAGASSLFTAVFGTGAPIPTDEAGASDLVQSLLGGAPIPTNGAEGSAFASSLLTDVFGTSALPTITNGGQASSIASSIAADVTASTSPRASPTVNAGAQSSSTGGVAPMQTGLGLMIAGGLAAGVAAIAL